MDARLTLPDLASAWVYGYLLVFCRVGTALSLLPAIGETSVPARVKLVLGLTVALVLMPVVPGLPSTVPVDLGAMLGAIVVEVAAGLALGLWVRLFFASVHVAGVVIAQQLTLAQMAEGVTMQAISPAVGNLLTFAAFVLLFALDLHLLILEGLVASYDLIPLGTLPLADLAMSLRDAFAAAFALGVRLSLPFLLVTFLVYAALGFVNRAVPQMMVFFVAAPAIGLIGLGLLLVALPVLLTVWSRGFAELLVAF